MAAFLSSSLLPPDQRLRQVLLSISRQAERDLALLPSRQYHACLHTLRVRMKKLRAILKLIEPGMTFTTIEPIRRRMREIKEAFAMNRDQHVLNALKTEFGGDGLPSSEWVPPGIEAGSDSPPRPVQLRRLRSTARELSRHLQTTRLRPLDWDDIARVYARCYKKARHWFRRCEHRPTADRLHHWRSLVKDHFFQSLLLLRRRRHLKVSRKLGSLLGKYHDLAMLLENSTQDSPGRFVHAVRRQMKMIRVRIFRKARRLFVPTPRMLARLSKTPLKAAKSSPKTGDAQNRNQNHHRIPSSRARKLE